MSQMTDCNNSNFSSSSSSWCFVHKCLADASGGEIGSLLDHQMYFFDMFFWAGTAFILCFGAPVSFFIVQYEHYGGDPQKRSLVNRFVSSTVMSAYMGSLFIQACVGAIRYCILLQQNIPSQVYNFHISCTTQFV